MWKNHITIIINRYRWFQFNNPINTQSVSSGSGEMKTAKIYLPMKYDNKKLNEWEEKILVKFPLNCYKIRIKQEHNRLHFGQDRR